MTTTERDRVVKVFSERIRSQNFLRLQHVPRVFEEENLDKALYTGVGPKRWIMENFPEFRVDTSKQIIIFASPPPSPPPSPSCGTAPARLQLSNAQRKALCNHFWDEIDRTGLCWCANVASFMRNNGMPEWRQLVHPGESLPAWLAREFPEFRHEMKNGASAIFPPDGTDAHCPRSSDAQLRSISFKFAYFPMNAELLGQFQQLTGTAALRHEAWYSVCVTKVANYLLGIDNEFLDDSGAQEPRMAFPLGQKTEKGQNIYVVLIPNSNANATQPWMMGGFCYPGQKDSAGYGKWLCQSFGLPSEDRDLVRTAYAQIRQRTQELEELRSSLLNSLEVFSAALERGEALPEDIARQVAKYQDAWGVLRESIGNAVISVPEDRKNLAYISGILDSKGAVSAQLDKATDAFNTLVKGAWNYLVDGWLCGEAHSDADLNAWARLRESGESEAGMVAGCRRLLQPFQALRELTRPRSKFDLTVSKATDAANNHFGMELTPPVVRSSFVKVIQDTPDALAFLSQVDVIESLLDYAESLAMDKHEVRFVSAQTAEGFSRSCAELLRATGGEDVSIGSILFNFARPDPLEQAIMLGQAEVVQNLLVDPASRENLELDEEGAQTILDKLDQIQSPSGGMSLYNAGMRLMMTTGSRHDQAERCFMVGLALRDIRCVECLFQLYQETGRNEEISALYAAYGGQVSEELRSKFVMSLLFSGSMDARQALQEDVLNFLTPELMERVATQEGFLPDETVQLLRKIYDRMDIPYVRYVVFLSSELQNYILHPENIASLQAAGLERTMEQLVSLTKSGHYSKGRSPLQTAQRTYHFMGTWGGLAEAFAGLAPEDTDVHAIRLHVARDRKDEDQMFCLLQSDPELRDRYWKDYAALLFSRGDYTAFLEYVSSQEGTAAEFPLQTVIAAMRTGNWDGRLPPLPEDGELVGCTHLVQELARALLDMGHMEQLHTLQISLFDQMLSLHNSEAIQRFITVDGAMGQEALSDLQRRALDSGCMSLAVYCGSVLGVDSERIAGQSEQYFSSLMQEALCQNAAGQLSAIQRIQIIFGEQYAAHHVQMFSIRFHAMLVNLDGADEEAVLADMLQPELPDETLRALLDMLDNSPVVNKLTARPALYEKLALACQAKEMDTDCLRFFHRHRDGQDGTFGRFLCQCYVSALNGGDFPNELLVEAESFALEQLQSSQDSTVAMCVYLIETIRGRLPFRAFTLCCLQWWPNWEGDADLENWLQNETSRFPADTSLTELGIFASVLADMESDVYEYLAFCRSFHLLTDEEKDNAVQMTGAYATETESILLLHILYQDFESAETWAMCCRLPFQDRPQVYARFLYCAALAGAGEPEANADCAEARVSWKRCVEYCRKNDQGILLFQVLLSWTQEILKKNGTEFPWYVTKELIAVIEDLYQKGDCIQDWPAEQAESLVNALCSIFSRINTVAAGDSNHKTLRTIDELAVLTGQEDVVLSCPNTQESLLGQNRKLGFVLALLLLRAGRAQKARSMLQTLVKLRDGMAYPVLLTELASKSNQELDAWRQTPVAMTLIKAILPDGNALNGLSIRTLIMEHILNDSCDVGISAVEELLRNSEHDCQLHVALFILCKQNYRNRIPQIYRALAGVYRNYSLDDRGIERSWYYTRTRKEVFRLLVITRVVMERLGLPIPEQDRDISEFLGSASLISQAGRQDRSTFVQDYNSLLNEVTGKFVGYDEQGSELWVEALMGAVTGNWMPFLLHAYEQKLVSRSYFECTNYSSWGLLRCVLQVTKSLPAEERSVFLGWLQGNVTEGKGVLKRLYAVHNIASALLLSCDLDAVSGQMLALPWEEHFICLGDLKDINSAEIGSCYHWMRRNTPFPVLESTLRVFIQIAQDVLKSQVLYGDAGALFEQGQDKPAALYYKVMYNPLGTTTATGSVPFKWTLYPGRTTELTNEQRNWYREIYQCRSRICAAFSGDQAVIEKLCRDNLKLRSCYNILVTMLASKRAGEIHRLARYFSGNSRRLAVNILKLVSPDVTDRAKLEIYDSFRRLDGAAEGLALLLSQKGRNGKYLFLQDWINGNDMRQRYDKLISSSYSYSFPCYLALTAPPDPSAFAQTEDAPVLFARDCPSTAETGPETGSQQAGPVEMIPSFALELQGQLSGQELPTLEELRSGYDRCSPIDYEGKMNFSGQIYCRISMDEQSGAFAVSEALIGYGLDYFAHHTSDGARSNPLLAFQAERELALYCKANPTDGAYYRSFVAKIPIALQRMFKSSPSVDALVQDYQSNTQGYDTLAEFVESRLPFFSSMFSVIQGLARSYSNINGPKLQNIENYKSVYSAALKQLEGLTIPREFGEEWLSVRNSLVTKLYDALNSLDQRPDLSVTVLNLKMCGMRSDALFGELQNTGRERAADIELQATFFDGENSWLGRKYGYANLFPGEKVAFALDYDIEKDDVKTLQYTLNVTYYHNQRQMSCAPEKGELTIVPEVPLAFSTDLYATDYPVQFDIDENGAVVGKDFFGREQQMESMRETVTGKSFPEFNNFVVRGIRRSGKTSLLNYLETYIGAVCKDTLVVRVDCQSIVTQPVQTAFITKVFNALERKLPAVTQTEAWQRLTEKWSLARGEADQSPDLLQDFYLDLDLVMNAPIPALDSEQSPPQIRKGLLLMIDEFDVMLHRMQSSQQDCVLLQGLRAITQSSDCRRVVHFVLCGSNNLISYTRKGERYYQTFQDFKPQIEVDELPHKDLEEMLLAPYRDDPEVVLPKETLEWVRRYTGGLVWYTKLLGNQMVKVAKENRRSVVYPSDVCKAFSSICAASYCLQFYEGCEDMEHDVLEAMASLSSRYQSYVTLDRLKEQLANMRRLTVEMPVLAESADDKWGCMLHKPHMDGQIADSIEKLIDLKLIQKDSSGRDRYCFKREIYRRFFRTQITRVDKGENLPDQMEPLNVFKKKESDGF